MIIATMLKNFKHIIKLAFLILLVHFQTIISAQEHVDKINFTQKDSILKIDLQLAKKQLYQLLLQNLSTIEINQQNYSNTFNLGSPINVYLSNNGLMFACLNNNSAEIKFSEIIDYPFKIYVIENNIQNSGITTEYKLKIGSIILSVKNNQLFILKKITNQFKQLQKYYNDFYFKINEFEQQVFFENSKQYNTAITEDVRKCIIQAEAFTKLYNYQKAIEINYELISIQPTAYPNVYLNFAILLAETNKLNSAIYNMKKFLLLTPTKEDEQFAKTKISEWEIILNN